MKKYYCIMKSSKEVRRTDSETEACSIIFLNKTMDLAIDVLLVNGNQEQRLNYNQYISG